MPVDLDLYVDSSGSMPDPQLATSYLALAGAIVALSALRAGASVQATLWSGTGQVTVTNGIATFEVEFNSPYGAYTPARAIIYSAKGTAFGETRLMAPATGGGL